MFSPPIKRVFFRQQKEIRLEYTYPKRYHTVWGTKHENLLHPIRTTPLPPPDHQLGGRPSYEIAVGDQAVAWLAVSSKLRSVVVKTKKVQAPQDVSLLGPPLQVGPIRWRARASASHGPHVYFTVPDASGAREDPIRLWENGRT